ncbi:hypothetical protein [Bradyrhizobium sp. sBnM-33]|uniref:hypothetical protein n=1 Tax=Bradyrhizobium sp. sBnM-33 TaxID=2831780 RepID=UPI001BCC4865|nr:hypothetical protein [Bradyrhizobium sp. sBnM-33]WOH50694.1 hypothetical protein RX328_42965 [Bradyrhizobium sp. sBnM-33]
MSHDHDFDYRLSAVQVQASLRHAGDDFAHNQHAADEGDVLGEGEEANEAFLRELDDDEAAPTDTAAGAQAKAIAVAPPVNASAEPRDTLTDDERAEVMADLEERDQRAAVAYPSAPPSKFDGHQKATTPEEVAALRERTAMLRDYQTERRRKDAATKAYRRKLSNEASARMLAKEREAKADARRGRDVARKREERAGHITARRTTALEEAIANHDGDHFLINLRGRAAELAKFRETLTLARAQHGPKASLTEIAAICGATKPAVQKRLKNVGKLEAKGGPWYRWRES